ncbi:uncharacterized protein [Dermacentor albipictus]|uniref:uncharacterized protein n=1 Tax=Dermacentor albipictus TaxID=60249 RepID=UPI0038FD1EA9
MTTGCCHRAIGGSFVTKKVGRMHSSVNVISTADKGALSIADYLDPMPQRFAGGLCQFIFHHLERATFGRRLRWVDRASGVFKLYWRHGNGWSESPEDDFAVFMAWHQHKVRARTCNIIQAKQRFRAAMNKMSLTILQRWGRWSPKKNFQFRKFPKEDLDYLLKQSHLGQNVPGSRASVAPLDKDNDADRDAEWSPSELPKSQLPRKLLAASSYMPPVYSDSLSIDHSTRPVPSEEREISPSDAVLMDEFSVMLEDEPALADDRATSVQVKESQMIFDYLSSASEANFVDSESSTLDSASGREGSVAFGNAEKASDSKAESVLSPHDPPVCDILLRGDVSWYVPPGVDVGFLEYEIPLCDWRLENGFSLCPQIIFNESHTAGSDHASQGWQAFDVHTNRALSGTNADGGIQKAQSFRLESAEPVEMKPSWIPDLEFLDADN